MLLSGPRLWAAVVGVSVDQLVAWGVLYYAYTVLSAPIAQDLGLPRLQVALGFSVCLLTAGFAGRLLGPFHDTRGTRMTLRAGAVVAPLALAALALARGTTSLLIAFVLLGVVQALALYEPMFRTIVLWCPDERTRSRAMLGLTSVGGFASTVFLPLTAWLSIQHGWRDALLVLAAVLSLVLIPLRFLLPLPHRPQLREPVAAALVPPSARRLAAGLSLHSLASTGVFVYLVWHLVERGDSLDRATSIAGIAGAAQVAGRMACNPLRRIVGRVSLLPFLLGVQATALLGLVLGPDALATMCILTFGAGSGMMTLESATVLVEWYGRATFGAHQGRLAAVNGTARAVSPFVVEAGHSVASYAVVFGFLCVVLSASAWACSSAAAVRALERG